MEHTASHGWEGVHTAGREHTRLEGGQFNIVFFSSSPHNFLREMVTESISDSISEENSTRVIIHRIYESYYKYNTVPGSYGSTVLGGRGRMRGIFRVYIYIHKKFISQFIPSFESNFTFIQGADVINGCYPKNKIYQLLRYWKINKY